MKNLFTLLFIGCLFFQAAAQCPSGNISLTNQNQVDSFLINYPNCTALTSNLVVTGTSVVQLNGLANLVSTTGNINIHHTGLSNLSGLDNMTTVGGTFRIFRNANLTQLTGLNQLESTGGGFVLSRNYELLNTTALENLTEVDSFFRVYRNINLTNLGPFDSLSKVGTLFCIRSNFDLTTIEGFNGLSDSIGHFLIRDNNSLNQINGFDQLKKVKSSFVISGNNLASITAFSNLEKVDSFFKLNYTLSLDNINGFQELQEVGSLRITGNSNISSISFPALSQVFGSVNLRLACKISAPALLTVGGDFIVQRYSYSYSNPIDSFNFNSITSIGGLLKLLNVTFKHFSMENLSSVKEMDYSFNYLSSINLPNLTVIQEGLNFNWNPNLKNINLNNLESIGTSLGIIDCDSLTTLSTFQNLNTIGNDVALKFNNLLSDCSYNAICLKAQSSPANSWFYNAPGCSSNLEIISNCQEFVFYGNGKTYIDWNCDSTYNGEDYGVQNLNIYNDQNELKGTSNFAGYYKFFDFADGLNTIHCNPISGFETPAEISYNAIVGDSLLNQDFRYCPSEEIVSDVSVSVTGSDVPQPGFTNYYTVCVKNNGNQIENVNLTLNTLPPVNSSVSFTYASSNGSINEDLITWTVANLLPLQEACFSATMLVQVDLSLLGDALNLSANAYFTDSHLDMKLDDNTDTSYQTILGSYDPNDKAANIPNFAIEDADSVAIEYLIRFQNTGNFPATFIEVHDTLEANLDLNSFKMIAASHPYSVTFPDLVNKTVIHWRFEDINLPDSTSDEPGSHGFIRFSVKVKNIDLSSQLSNSAGIYFDYNPPVLTNTAISEVGNALPVSSSFIKYGEEDQIMGFQLSDFPAIDQIYPFTSLQFGLPTNGTLKLNGATTVENQLVSADSLPFLFFHPDLNYNIQSSSNSLTFKAKNQYGISSVHTISIHIFPINDSPIAASFSVTTDINQTYEFSTEDFVFEDVENQNPKWIKLLSLPTNGLLNLENGGSVPPLNENMYFYEVNNLNFTPDQNVTGNPVTSFDFVLIDFGGLSTDTLTANINVTDPSNSHDQPSGWNLSCAPNPVDDFLLFKGDFPALPAEVELFDATGKLLERFSYPAGKLVGAAFSMQQLPAAAYLLKVKCEGNEFTFRLLKR